MSIDWYFILSLRQGIQKARHTSSFLYGRQEATDIELLEPLANSILQHWDFTSLAEQFTDLDKLFKPAYNVEYAY